MIKYIIYDLEATCWLGRPPKGANEVIEIGAVKLNEYGEFVDDFNLFVKPYLNPILSPFCKRLTTITQGQVNRAKLFPVVFEQFFDWINIDEDYVMCSWGDADKRLLVNDCHLHKIPTDWTENYRDLKKQYHRIKDMNKFTGLKRTLKREGFEFTGVEHRAISDAENLSKIFVKYLDDWDVW